MNIKHYNVHPAVYFFVAALLMAYFFPREAKFKYQFYEGKPWKYGLLTASTNFPIYKTDSEVKEEQDSVMKKFQPYYRVHSKVETSEIDKLRADYNQKLNQKVNATYMRYIEDMLRQLYDKGIVSPQDLEEMKEKQYTNVNLLQNNVSFSHYVSDFFTVKTAYEFIINNCPAKLNKSLLQSCDINNYLTENVTYDRRGMPVENSFMQYKIPTRQDIGHISVAFESSYEETGPYGAKSIGEVVINTPLPALADAVYNATGKRFCELPITPEQIAMAAK